MIRADQGHGMHTGVATEYSYHLYSFTEEEEEATYKLVTARR